ncbi:TonB-dependent receptor [Rheinheimera maricola]|uniref:TonB-dependent receptor n=1 Tax=Rheinheimera maricola TaxID=2793282 RepID=A0ABS7XDB9_9GAMM|nr:TonB-dependent receptor [Rheinheimera maricola]MBZ9613531.1 TonB-dependent receptor [Rheinheimera maricola]
MATQQQRTSGFRAQPLAWCIGLALASPLGTAVAQDNNNAEKTESKIETITVTAQKRVQNVMDVPLAIDSVSAEDLTDTSSVLLGDIADYTPGFKFSKEAVAQASAEVRGISSSNISTGGDPSVAIFFDDFYLPRAAQSVLFSDMQRIEILKGPQGTLFGKNAAAGVVNMIPNAPRLDDEAFVKATLGDYALQRFEVMGNKAISDNFALRLNLMSNKRDAYVDNLNPDYQGNELGSVNHRSARLSALWQLSDATKVQFSYDWDDVDQGYAPGIGISPFAYSMNPADRKIENDVVDGHESRDMTALSLKVFHDFNDQWSAKFISSKRQWQVSGRDDADGTADKTRYLDTINFEDSDIFYNELQLNNQHDKLSYVGGITYSKENVYQKTSLNILADTIARLTTGSLNQQLVGALQQNGMPDEMIAQLGLPADHIWNPQNWASMLSVMAMVDPSVAGLLQMLGAEPFSPELVAAIAATGDLTYDAIGAGLGIAEIFGPSNAGKMWSEDIINTGDFTSYGLYSDIDYQLNDRWGFTAGLRYSRDDKDFSWEIKERAFGQPLPGITDFLFPLMPQLNASNDWSKLTGRAVGRYHLDANQMLYLSYSTGYKSGGYDSLDPRSAFTPFEPEEVANIELGYKADLWQSVRVQLVAYQMDLTNRQRSVNSKEPDAGVAIPIVINGDQDIQGGELVLDWQATDTLKLGLVTEYRKTESKWQQFYNADGELVTDVEKSSSADSYTLSADWTPEYKLAGGGFKLHIDYVFEENTRADDPDLLAIAYQIPGYFADTKNLNGRISWASHDEQWQLALWGKNLTDHTTIGGIGGFAAAALGTPISSLNAPRTVGVDVRYQF